MSHLQLAAVGAAPGRRKQLGQWYTPISLVTHLVDVVRTSRTRLGRPMPATVLDPSCGDGRFLAAARAAFGPAVRLVGIDVDAAAVDAARAAVPGAELIHADALSPELLAALGDRSFDLVIGNPPFLNQLASATSRRGRSQFGGGPYADVAAEFLALAGRLATPDGGQVALVLPQSLLTSRDAEAMRIEAGANASITHAWWSTTLMFDAAVHVCALVLTRGEPQRAVTRTHGPHMDAQPPATLARSWGRLLIEAPTDISEWEASAHGRTLGDIATWTADFREQYYGLIGAVSDDPVGPPLVTCGLIDPGSCHWGERPARFAKQVYHRPRVDLAQLAPRLQRWAAQRLVPKLLVANQTSRIEAVIDRHGAWLPSVPVITCVPHDEADLDLIASVLHAPEATEWVRERAAGSGLSPRAIRLNPSLLAAVPAPIGATRTAAR